MRAHVQLGAVEGRSIRKGFVELRRGRGALLPTAWALSESASSSSSSSHQKHILLPRLA